VHLSADLLDPVPRCATGAHTSASLWERCPEFDGGGGAGGGSLTVPGAARPETERARASAARAAVRVLRCACCGARTPQNAAKPASRRT